MAPGSRGAATTTRTGALVALTALVALAVALPFVLRAFGLDFYLSLASRIVVYAIAATSLNPFMADDCLYPLRALGKGNRQNSLEPGAP